ncbi:MAG TPA: histidine kinase [Clostridia bacterium]|nr:histidine kinase [Clostridia bacterium]
METNLKPKTLWVMYLALAVALFSDALRYAGRLWLLLLLTGFLVLSFTARHMALSANEGRHSAGWLAYIADIALVLWIEWQVGRDAALLFYIIVLCDACILCARPFGYAVALMCLIAYALGGVLKPGEGLAADISVATGAFFVSAAFVSIVRKEMETRIDHDRTLDALKTKSKQLEDAYAELKQSVELRMEMTALKERARITGEMHDTVGHALTAGLYSLEAGEHLLSRGDRQAERHIALAAEQIRSGLRELRQTVHAMNAEKSSFTDSIRTILEQTRSQGIFIRDDVCDPGALGEDKKAALLLALKEGLSNGIRHGRGTAFVFSLSQQGPALHFVLEDNGKGTEVILPGFGLVTMERRVREAGGILRLSSKAGEGFRIEIDMPLEGSPWTGSAS